MPSPLIFLTNLFGQVFAGAFEIRRIFNSTTLVAWVCLCGFTPLLGINFYGSLDVRHLSQNCSIAVYRRNNADMLCCCIALTLYLSILLDRESFHLKSGLGAT